MGKCLFMRKGETHSAPSTGILASDLAVGSSVYLNENGSPVEYLIVNQGIPSDSSVYDSSCNGTWLLRKDIYTTQQWGNTNYYNTSYINEYLQETFLNFFDSEIQSNIKQVKIPYMNVSNVLDNLSVKLFLLSGTEVGFPTTTGTGVPVDGSRLSYFTASDTDSNRIAYLNGVATQWWLRSRDLYSTNASLYVTSVGGRGANTTGYSYGVRPALILPSNALFDSNTLVLKGVA